MRLNIGSIYSTSTECVGTGRGAGLAGHFFTFAAIQNHTAMNVSSSFRFADPAAVLALLALLAWQTPIQAQTLHAVWVMNEGNAPTGMPSLGRFDPETNVYEEIMTFPEAAFASDVVVESTGVYVAADSKIYRLDADTYEVLAEAEIPGVRKLQVFAGKLYATRGDVSTLDSYLWSLDLENLEVVTVHAAAANEGPMVAAEGMTVVDDMLVIAINNGFVWGEETGQIGWLTPSGSYTETALPAGAENPVHIFAHDGDVCFVSNGSWDGTALSRVDPATGDVQMTVLADVSAGCNAAALVEDRLAFQISGESDLRQVDAATLAEAPGLVLSGNTYYSMATDPLSGTIFAAHTDWYSYGEVEMFAADGAFLGSFTCGVSPGNLAVEIRETTAGLGTSLEAKSPFVPVAAWDLSGRALPVEARGAFRHGVRIEQDEQGAIRKVIRP